MTFKTFRLKNECVLVTPENIKQVVNFLKDHPNILFVRLVNDRLINLRRENNHDTWVRAGQWLCFDGYGRINTYENDTKFYTNFKEEE